MISVWAVLFGTLCIALGTMAASPEIEPFDRTRVLELANTPDPERIKRDIAALVNFGTRHTLSRTDSDRRGIGAARRWIRAQFETISRDCGGCLEVLDVAEVVEAGARVPEPVNVVNVIAIQRGTLDPARVAIMSGDIDSRVSDVMDAESDSPGANDNASGVAGVLEAARLLSRHRFAGTLVYAALSGEEQGLIGGRILAAHAKTQDWRVVAVLNNDMIGNITGINGVTDNRSVRVFSEGTRAVETAEEARTRRFTGGEVDSASRNLARYVHRLAMMYMPHLDVMMVYRLDRFGRGGHHSPFNDAGFPAVRIMETNEHYDRQHQDVREEDGVRYGDTLDGVDTKYAATVTGLNVLTLANLAAAPPFPTNVTIEGAVSPDTTLRWTESSGTRAQNLAGYRVYWRLTTDAQWRWFRDVGLTDVATLKNVVIDNYFFGVASVARDGTESPVVFPGPAGGFE